MTWWWLWVEADELGHLEWSVVQVVGIQGCIFEETSYS